MLIVHTLKSQNTINLKFRSYSQQPYRECLVYEKAGISLWGVPAFEIMV